MSGEGEGGIVNFLRGEGVWIFSGMTQFFTMVVYNFVTELTDSDGVDKTNNEAIAAEFFEEYVCDEGEESTSQGKFILDKAEGKCNYLNLKWRWSINGHFNVRFKQPGYG